MLLALLIVSSLTFLLLLALLLRKPHPAPVPEQHTQMTDLLGSLPAQLARSEAVTGTLLSALDQQLRSELSGLRSEIAEEARKTRTSSDYSSAELRKEITQSITVLGATLLAGLDSFRTDNATSAEILRQAVQQQLENLEHRLTAFTSEQNQHHLQSREALHARLTDLGNANIQHLDSVRFTVEEGLTKLNADNAAKLEEMRQTVDEKLHATLQSRLTESFGQVTTHLGEVQKGLGEMKQLATGVGDLKKVLSNVKSRGVVGEFQLGMQLDQMFSPDQYIKNARIKASTGETVEYALKFPSGNGDSGPESFTLLPIDAKFPKEDWERLEYAYDHGTSDEIANAGKAFERAIRTEGKRICEKYIDPPTTLPHGIMFLPTENLYAEVVRRPGLQSEIQQQCHITIAGPSTFMAILTSFQMGFQSLKLEKKGHEIRSVLERAKNEFDKFGGLMDKVRKQVDTVQNTLTEIGGKTKTINFALKNVASINGGRQAPNLLAFEESAPIVPWLAAAGEND